MATLTRGIKLSELADMSPDERSRQIGRLFEDALNPTEDERSRQLTKLNEKIRDFERKYEMPSAIMLQKLADGTLRETADICSWMLLLNVRKRSYADRD